MSSTTITVSAPGKLMLTGSYAVVHGHSSVSTAVDQRLFVTANSIDQPELQLTAPDLGLENYRKPLDRLGKDRVPKPVRFVETVYAHFLEEHPQASGARIETKNHFSAQFGFGSSSAVTVAATAALLELHGIEYTKESLFERCYRAVLEVQGVGSGYDLATAIWGGTLQYRKPAELVRPLDVNNMPILVAYTGIKADTPTLVRMVNAQLENRPTAINGIFDEIGRISNTVADEISTGDWKRVGALLSKHQQACRELDVSTGVIEQILTAAEDAGAYGGTLSGAGGGDCVVIVAPDDRTSTVTDAVRATGGRILDVNLHAPGVKIES